MGVRSIWGVREPGRQAVLAVEALDIRLLARPPDGTFGRERGVERRAGDFSTRQAVAAGHVWADAKSQAPRRFRPYCGVGLVGAYCGGCRVLVPCPRMPELLPGKGKGVVRISTPG